MNAIPTSEDLIALFEEGKLAIEMARRFSLSNPAELELIEARCAELHNTGIIDLLRLIECGAFQGLSGADFFIATDFFCRILPELDARPTQMMVCVDALVIHGGEDMVATKPNAAFRTWCKKDLRRAREIIDAAQADDDLAIRHLTFALEAIHGITDARQIALLYNDSRRLSAITALGRMKDDDPESRLKTFITFNNLLETGADDNQRANMLGATAAILAHDPHTHLPVVESLIIRLVEDPSEFTLHQSAHILWVYCKAMQQEIIAALLKALTEVNPSNKGTLRELDYGLQSLMELGYDDEAIGYVTQLLSRQDNDLELEEFKSFTNTLISGPSERLGRVVVQWLLKDTPSLCKGISKAIRGLDAMDGPPLHIRAEDLSMLPSAQVFICRKAIGWFFLRPTTAASVIVSVLRICDPETAQEVQKLLSGILLNYGGLRDYLEGLAPDDTAMGHVVQVLTDNRNYLEALRSIPLITELQPSEHHRRIEQLRMSDQMRDAQKQAQSQSVLLSMVKRSVLLYGNRSISFIKDVGGKLRPMEMDLEPFGISFEMPRMEVIDPVGLTITISIFRSESIRL